jgi:hypothetical protein
MSGCVPARLLVQHTNDKRPVPVAVLEEPRGLKGERDLLTSPQLPVAGHVDVRVVHEAPAWDLRRVQDAPTLLGIELTNHSDAMHGPNRRIPKRALRQRALGGNTARSSERWCALSVARADVGRAREFDLLDCDTVAVILTVRIPEYELEENGRVLSVGDDMSSWLMFEEAGRSPLPAEHVRLIRGVARLLPSWPGAETDRHPVQIEVDRGVLYWDAPEPVEGIVEIAGSVSSNIIDAPEGFPATTGVVRRVRMEWREFVHDEGGGWRNEDCRARYEDVPATYFPIEDLEPSDPEVEAAAIREAFKGRKPGGESSPAGAFLSYGIRSEPEGPLGTTKTVWTGVLIDLDTTGLVHE